MAGKWDGVIFACEECVLRYTPDVADPDWEAICPVHGTEFTVAFEPTVTPEYTHANMCVKCGSESTPALKTDRGLIGELVTDTPHCPDCGSVNQALRLVGMRELTETEATVIGERNRDRRLEYDRVKAFDAAEGGA